MKYIIVQSGGRGTRMQKLTKNKPKALIPIENLPLIFHLFRKFPDKKFIIIGDYKYDVLDRYLRAFADVNYELVSACGHSGTCSGIQTALSRIPEKESFMLIWCDLVLPDSYELPGTDANIIGIAKDFPCRWKWEDGGFAEEESTRNGVAGLFIFREKRVIERVPLYGEFVRWLCTEKILFEEQPLYQTKEYGSYSEWEKAPRMQCRPFNRVVIERDKVVKKGIDAQGRKLAKLEADWYRKAEEKRFSAIPKIESYEPLSMERIDGKNVFELTEISRSQKTNILVRIINCLKEIHDLGKVAYNEESYREAYLQKTFYRLEKVRDLIPFANTPIVTVNGKECRNILFHQKEVEELIMKYAPCEFVFLHGDCTFSNILLKDGGNPIFIDPRGYFGKTRFYGDGAYDWAKLYYSLIGNYDQFNLKRFDLDIGGDSVELKIASNGWEDLEDCFFESLEGVVDRQQMSLFLAVIWSSLTTYVWEDYDSICGAFYNGLVYFENSVEQEQNGIF